MGSRPHFRRKQPFAKDCMAFLLADLALEFCPTKLNYCLLLEILAGVLEIRDLLSKLLLFMVRVALTIKHNPFAAIFMCKMKVLMAIVSALR